MHMRQVCSIIRMSFQGTEHLVDTAHASNSQSILVLRDVWAYHQPRVYTPPVVVYHTPQIVRSLRGHTVTVGSYVDDVHPVRPLNYLLKGGYWQLALLVDSITRTLPVPSFLIPVLEVKHAQLRKSSVTLRTCSTRQLRLHRQDVQGLGQFG